jgi:hypothetical protein
MPSGHSWEPWSTKAFPGFNIKFQFTYNGYTIEAHVKWNNRSWFDGEPYAMSLKLNGGSLENPTSSYHPNLWRVLRYKARNLIANSEAVRLLRHYGSARVTLAMIEDLISRNDRGALYALYTSDTAPLNIWDQEAWSRFLDWQTR